MSAPTQTCQLCGRQQVVTQDGRGFPPDIAKRKLKKQCNANGCPSEPQYLAGMSVAVRQMMEGGQAMTVPVPDAQLDANCADGASMSGDAPKPASQPVLSEIEVTLTDEQWELVLEAVLIRIWDGKPWDLSIEKYKRLREANALIREAMYG